MRVAHHESVAVVTMARPPANAMTADGLLELADTVQRLGVDEATCAVVITGQGRTFSAGLDLRGVIDMPSADQESLIEALNQAFLAVYSCPRLVVAAVNGHAIAGGLVLALCCDVRLVADVELKAGLAEVRVGVVYPVGAIEVVRHELAPSVARRLVLTGANVDAHEGVALGVFDRVVPPDGLLDAAVAVARDHPPPEGFAKIKAQLRQPALASMRDALDGRDQLLRPWLTAEAFAAARAALG